MKKILFTVSFLVAASAFAIFIPLQKDGSVRWTNNSQGYATVEGILPSVPDSATRMPAGQQTPDAYVEPPTYTPPEEPAYTPPPQEPVYTPPPQYSGDFSCLSKGFRDAGYRNVSQGYINMVAARAKMHHDGAKSGFLFWRKVDQEKNHKNALRTSIFTLAALGPCRGYPEVGGEFLQRTATPDEYRQTFRLSTEAIKKNHVTPWNPTGAAQISATFNHYARRQNGQIYNCTKVKEPQPASTALCKALIRACGVGRISDCEYQEPRDNDNDRGNNNGNNGGDNNGGNNNGNNNNNSNNNGGQGETPNGETNDGNGYGSDGSNNGGGQGDGPPGS